MDKKVFKTGDQKQHALREQRICESFAKGLSHVNIVQVYDVITENDSIYIIMENVEGGELFDRIKQSKGLTENCARKWFREIIEAVQYIHQVRKKKKKAVSFLHILRVYVEQYYSSRLETGKW